MEQIFIVFAVILNSSGDICSLQLVPIYTY